MTKHEASPAPARTAVALTSPASLLQMAVEKGADLATLERLMDLQDRHEANQARKAYVEAMTAFKSEPIEILKRKKVSFETSGGGNTSYSHAELSDITEAIGPAMAKHHLSYRWDIDQQGAAITVHCIVMHIMGHSEKVTMVAGADGSGKKNAIQQVASAVTYLQRYTLLAATGMSTKGIRHSQRPSSRLRHLPLRASARNAASPCPLCISAPPTGCRTACAAGAAGKPCTWRALAMSTRRERRQHRANGVERGLACQKIQRRDLCVLLGLRRTTRP